MGETGCYCVDSAFYLIPHWEMIAAGVMPTTMKLEQPTKGEEILSKAY